MEKTTVYLPADLHRAVKETAKREQRSQADLIREVLAAYVKQQPRKRPRSIGAGADGGVSGAESEDWINQHWPEDLIGVVAKEGYIRLLPAPP